MMMSPTLTLSLWSHPVAVVASSLRVTSKETQYDVESVEVEVSDLMFNAVAISDAL